MSAPIFLTPNVPVQAVKRDGIIGATVLMQHHHVIDFAAKKLRLKHDVYFTRSTEVVLYPPNHENFIEKEFNKINMQPQIEVPIS